MPEWKYTMNKPMLYCAILLSMTLVGCQSLKTDGDNERDWLGREKEIQYGIPSKIVAIWTNSVFNEIGERPVRGLGGRVYFYDGKHRAVRVDGSVSVFLFDDTKSDQEGLKQEATKKVFFSAEEVAASYSPSEFGPSYSLWVPWDEVGGERKQLNVIPVFTNRSGQMLVGKQARHLLPGSDPIDGQSAQVTEIAQASFRRPKAKEANHEVVRAVAESDADRVKIKSSTIKLPPSMQQRVSTPPTSSTSASAASSKTENSNHREPRSWDFNDRTKVSVTESRETAADNRVLRIDQLEQRNDSPLGLRPDTMKLNPIRSGSNGTSAKARSRSLGTISVATPIANASDPTSAGSSQQARSPQRPLQATSSPSALLSRGRGRSPLAPGGQLFDR